MSLLDPRAWLAALLATAMAAGLGYWRGHATGAAGVQARWNADTTRQQLAATQRALAAEQENRQREQDLRNAAESNTRQVQTELADARRAGAVADAAGSRLRQQVARLVADAKARPVACAAGAGQASATGPAAIDLLAELHARTDEAAGQLAAVADEARIRGEACERAYDAVTTAQNPAQ